MKNAIFIIAIMAAFTARSQSAIAFDERSIYQEFGHSDYTTLSGDTVIRTYFGGEEIVYFVDAKVVRQISILTRREARREQRVLDRWNKERYGWYWTGITKCRITNEDGYIMECRKYDRHNPIPETITQKD